MKHNFEKDGYASTAARQGANRKAGGYYILQYMLVYKGELIVAMLLTKIDLEADEFRRLRGDFQGHLSLDYTHLSYPSKLEENEYK